MKIVAPVFLAILLALQSTKVSKEKKITPVYRAESSASMIESKDGTTYVTENRSFRFAGVLGDAGNDEALLLLEETYHNERKEGIEGVVGKTTIKAWTLETGRARAPRWTIHEGANEGDRRDRFLRLIAWGCCDIPTVHSYYNMLTGDKVFFSNSDLLEIREADFPGGSRFVGFGYAGQSQLTKPPVLQYGSDRKVFQRLSVISSREYYDAPKIFVATNEKLENSLDLRGSPLTFAIVLKYSDGVELRIPVEADVIQLAKATVPHGYSLRIEK
jgi:hypothetical protein